MASVFLRETPSRGSTRDEGRTSLHATPERRVRSIHRRARTSGEVCISGALGRVHHDFLLEVPQKAGWITGRRDIPDVVPFNYLGQGVQVNAVHETSSREGSRIIAGSLGWIVLPPFRHPLHIVSSRFHFVAPFTSTTLAYPAYDRLSTRKKVTAGA